MKRILLVTILVQATLFAVRPMVSYRALAVGADPFALGVVAASFSVLSLLIAVPVGRWVDRRGERGAVLGGALVVGVVSASLVLVKSVPLLAVTQAVLGCGHIMNVVGVQAWIGNRSGSSGSDRNFGHFTVAVSLGQLLGPAVAGLLAGPAGMWLLSAVPGWGTGRQQAISLVFAACSIVCLVAVVAAAGLSPSRAGVAAVRPRAAGAQTSVLGILRVPSMPQAILVSLTVLTAVDVLATYLPAYGESGGLSVETVGFLLATRGAASLASRLVMDRLVERFDRGPVLVCSTAGPALILLLLPLTDVLPLLFAAMIVIGFGLGLGQPITLAWVAGRVPADTRGAALGLRLSANRLGQVIFPAAVGAVAGALGVASIFSVMAVLLGVSTGAALSASFTPRDDGPEDPALHDRHATHM